MNQYNKKETNRYREQTRVYLWGEGWGKEQDKEGNIEAQTTRYKIDKIQGCILQHKEYKQFL